MAKQSQITTICTAFLTDVVVPFGRTPPAIAHGGLNGHAPAVEATRPSPTHSRHGLVSADADAGGRHSEHAVIQADTSSVAPDGSSEHSSRIECCCIGVLCHA